VPRTSRGRELRAVLRYRLVVLCMGEGREREGMVDVLGDWGGGGEVPCVCDDDVVEWGVLFAEAGEADS